MVAPLLTAPFPAPISATDPAAQAAQSTVDCAEYVPELHSVHVVAALFTAPVPAPSSVMEPEKHVEHEAAPTDEYCPDAHVEHSWFEAAENFPAAHGVHVVAPLLTAPFPAPVSAVDPAEHT